MGPLLRFRTELGLVSALVAMGGFFAATCPHFATRANLLQIMVDVAVIGIVTVGEFFVIVSSYYQSIIKGAVLITAVLADTAVRRRGKGVQ
jgi:ribose/xylose/arabinose/galactoside ABC-type transport system permease subunit